MNLKAKIESLLFISAKPMSIKHLADLIEVEQVEIEKYGDELFNDYFENKRGIAIIKNNDAYQMVNSVENSALVQKFINKEIGGELSKPSLETLTVIAYRGPISKNKLNTIRGVNCALILRNLILRSLIESKFDKQKQETYYNISFDFLRLLGIGKVEELPDYEELNSQHITHNS